MTLSAILVVARPATVERCIAALNDLPAVEVHHRDGYGRIIVVQEAASVEDEIEGLQAIEALPDVVSAELVHHYLGDGTEGDGLAAGSAQA